jgi:tripartite-type tricarboxylate transporter receptor subunit TctC
MSLTGVKLVDVPYRGAPPALADLLTGQIQIMFDNVPTSLGFIRDGRLRPLAVTVSTRVDTLPSLPPLGEFLPGYDGSLWQGLAAPKNTPLETINKLSVEIKLALSDPQFKSRIVALGGTPSTLSAAEFGDLIAKDTQKWGKVIRKAGLRPD